MIRSRNKKRLTILITLLMVVGALFTTVRPPVYKTEARSLVDKWMCKTDLTTELYMFAETDYFNYLTRSKSAMASVDKVDKGVLNRLLEVSGYKFGEVNEAILGRKINSVDLSEVSPEDANAGAPKVSAFDRFGMAGLTWSSYAGEWKYSHVDVCSENREVSSNNYGSFYEGRLEPQSSYNEVDTSRDARSIQFAKGFGSIFSSTFMNTVSNTLFGVAKTVVTLTIVFVGLAFTDITVLIGMTAEGTAGGTATGVFTTLFSTIFTGFVLITFVFTAVYMMYNIFFKRQIRMALNTLIKTILIFMIAIIMASNPTYWIGLPNKVATYGQGLILNSVTSLYENDTDYVSLCSTNVGAINDGVDLDNAKGSEGLMVKFDKVSENMKSVIGCQLWEQFLFKPWVRGQFGVEYEELSSDKLGNINSSWTGKGSVPVGEGKTIDNWALFHLSTQTDAHAQLGKDNFPVYINGVNADWWRTVDAFSNYDEEQILDTSVDIEHTVPTGADPLIPWQTWIGNNSTERMSSAIIAILFGVIGSIAPLIFAMSSAVMGLGITIMMMTSPIFLLLGTWGGRGDGIFMGWLSALANMVLKKIVYSLLLILSISLTMSLMNLAYEIGIITSFILLVLIMVILIKNREALVNMIASVDFGGTFNPMTKAKEYKDKQVDRAGQVGELALAATVGGVAGVKTGQGFFRGANSAAGSQLRNTLYKSESGRYAAMELESRRPDYSVPFQCQVCQRDIGAHTEEIAYRNEDGSYYCIDCADEMGTEELFEVILGGDKKGVQAKNDVRTVIGTSNRSYLSHSNTRDMMESTVDKDGNYHWNNERVQSVIEDNITRLREDIVVFSNVRIDLGDSVKPPSVPEPLHSYIDLAMINEAWSNGNMEMVENTYKAAWGMWYEDNGENVSGLTEEEIQKFKEAIIDFNPEISVERSEELTTKFMEERDPVLDDIKLYSNNKDERVYSFKDGQLDFSRKSDKYNPSNDSLSDPSLTPIKSKEESTD